ncbi:hypothetical protein BGW80DRAFT_690716 [Lactifluus volemus]|nr:hypothetical protein BGW80DRAFT_690716 [Lactifluus volemus]
MVKSYYTVIVGTRPGVYEDWIQAAPKVCGIPGAVHKKFKTCAEAWRVYNRAEREGEVRVIEVEPDAEVRAEAARALAHLSPARDNHQRPSPQVSQEALRGHAVVQATHPTSRPGRYEIGNRTGSGNGTLPHPTTRTLDPGIGLSTYPHGTVRSSPVSLRTGDQSRVLGHAGPSGRGSTIRRPADSQASSSFALPHGLQQVTGGHENIRGEFL